MQSFWATPADPPPPPKIHPALNSFADECCATLARLVAYVGTLALFAIVGLYLWEQLPGGAEREPAGKASWNSATRWSPAFAVHQSDSSDKPAPYGFFRDGDPWPARRAAIGCMLDRLIPLTAGNEPKLAETFARAELNPGTCAAAGASNPPSGWVTAAETLGLRGPL